MKFLFKVVLVLVVAILLIASYFIISNYLSSSDDEDTVAPVINEITRNTNAVAGKTVIISVNFSDDVGVTNATLYYKTAGEDDWNFTSILEGSVYLFVPLDPIEDMYYYVTVDDAAGNGPVGDPSIDGSEYYVISVVEEDGDGGDDQDSTHYVFIEEASTTDCRFCPDIADILHDLYEFIL